METPTDREVLVFALLNRVSKGSWAKYRGTFQTLRYSFPITVVNRKFKGRVSKKVIAFLKRHEHIWVNAYKLLGWEVAERYEMELHEFVRMYEELRKALETLKSAGSFPDWLSEHLKPAVSLGGLSYDEAMAFLELVRKRFSEYMEAPKAMKEPRREESRFHKLLRTSNLAVLVVSGTSREEQLKRVSNYLYELLSKGVVPVDYSHNTIIVARKVYRHKGVERIWRSSLGLDPVEVLKGFESRYVPVITDIRRLEFEKRDIGWGLKAIPAS